MRTSSVLPAILLGFVILLTTTTGQAAWPEDLDVSGTVVDGDGVPLQGVNVTAENTTSGIEYHAITGEGGNYSLSLPSGTYNLTGVLVNYSANNTYNMLQVDSNITDLDITMTEVMGAVTGYVTNGTVPIVGAEVFLRNDQNEYNIMSTIPLGRYDIVDVEPGTYIAYAVKDGYQTNYSDLPCVRNAKMLLLECTFFEPDHISRARAGNHIHLVDLPDVLEGMNNERIVLVHLTRRTNMGLARKVLRKALPKDVLERITFLMSRKYIEQ